MTSRNDYLSVCNDKSVPEKDFTMSFCNRCTQKDCNRSQYGTSPFDRRVNTWEDRLFKDIPRMSKDDPRYLPLVSVDFKAIEEVRTTVAFDVPKWFDPRDIPSSAVAEPVADLPLPVTSKEEVAKVNPTPPLKEEQEVEPPKLTAPHAKNLPRDLLLLNTETSTFTLPGAPKQAVADKWSGPVGKGEAPSSVPVVKKGATIKFGGSGVE